MLKNQSSERHLFKNRFWIVIALIILLMLLLLARLFYLQIIEHHYYTTLSKKNQIDFLPVAPQRGLIYDRNGVLLAKNIPVFSLMVTPDQTNNLKEEIEKIALIIPLSETELKLFYRQLKQHRPFQTIPLKIKLTEKEVAIFAVNRYRFAGVNVQAQLLREYPEGESFSHVLGYVGRINPQELNELNPTVYADTNYIGKTGIEKYYEAALHGAAGYQSVETDASGQALRILGLTLPKPGIDLHLTLDSRLQKVAEKTLAGLQGSIVVLDVKTGDILAMVSQPSFDPNLFVGGISQKNYTMLTKNKARPMYNRAIHGLYAIASTIKPFLALQGLKLGTITPEYKIFDPGWYTIPGTKHIFHDWHKAGHGWVNLNMAISHSCDTYFYTLAYNLGINPIHDILSQFGFGQATGVDLPNELPGTTPSPESKLRLTGKHWYPGDTVNTSIGQGYTQATPIQLAYATMLLANQGKASKPHLLAYTEQHQQRIENKPEATLQVKGIAKKYWHIVIHAMQNVLRSGGTGYHHFGTTPSYSVAAKTGTAQVRSHHENEDLSRHQSFEEANNSLFIAFAPVEHPQIVVVTVIEHTPEAAVMATRKMMDAYFELEKPEQKKSTREV